MENYKERLNMYESQLAKKLEDYKNHLNTALQSTAQRHIQDAIARYEQSNQEAFQRYEESLQRYDAETIKYPHLAEMFKKSAKDSLESSLNFNKKMLDQLIADIKKLGKL
jgi:hypothetical protein